MKTIIEPLQSGHLGDRRKWPLKEMAFVELSKQESAGTKKVADVERWLLVEI